MGKMYIPVKLYVDTDGKITPKEIKAGYDGEWLTVDKVTDSRRRASLQVGAVGIRYSCVVNINEGQRDVYLFDEDGRWWIFDGEQ
jgi:hypothetical protein